MYTKDIKLWLDTRKSGQILIAKKVYEDAFTDMKETTFYQLLARLCNENVVYKLAKGLYYKPVKKEPDYIPPEDKLVDFFTNRNKNGMIVGLRLLKKYGIVDEESKDIDIFTNTLEIKTTRHIRNINIQSVDLDFKNEKIVKTIEALEIIKCIRDLAVVNYDNIKSFFSDFVNYYDSKIIDLVLSKKSYKKRDIAALNDILNSLSVKSNLKKYLNPTSKYEFSNHVKVVMAN